MVLFTLFPTPIGHCGVAWRDHLIVATHLPEEAPVATARRLASRSGGSEGEPPSEILSAIALMTALLEGEKTDLTQIACDLRGVRPFAAKVYEATRAIPAGRTVTYGAIARQLGGAQLAQGVGRALGRNPVPIIVPCHRVLGANDRLTGFSAHGGVQTKLRMLEIEGADIGRQQDLFGGAPLT